MFKRLEISIRGLLTIRSWQIFGIGAGLSQTAHLSAIEHTHFHPLKPVIPNQGYEYAGVGKIGMLGMMLIASASPQPVAFVTANVSIYNDIFQR